MGWNEAGAGGRDAPDREAAVPPERKLRQPRREREFLAAVLRHLPAGVAIVEAASRRLVFRNAQADAILGLLAPEADAHSGLWLRHADGRPYAAAELPLARALAGEAVAGEEIHLDRGPDAIGTAVQVAAIPIRDGEGRVVAAALVFEDVTARKIEAARVARLALHDPLTGLPNRALFQDRLALALALARRAGGLVAVMLLDLDGFKDVNDTLGHQAGDRLLRAIAARLAPGIRASDTLARIGGDEFALVQVGVGCPADAEALAAKLGRLLTEPCEVDGQIFHVSASLGVALFPRDGDDEDALLRRADLALYRAKAEGGAGFRFFEKAMDEAARARRELEIELRRALERDELFLHYQPQLDLASGRFTGAEALARWRHPERGLVLPGEFIPLAETTGLIRPLGAWVLREACRQAAAWRTAGLSLTVAVNLSPAQLRGQGVLPPIDQELRRSGLAPAKLELEITEGVLMETFGREADDFLQRLLAHGVRLAIDDFGVGYSSLAYLRRLPVHKIKVDRSFVAAVGADKGGEALLRSIVALGQGLGKRVVAEGVETAAQLAFVRAAGCEEAQGFHLAPPLPAAAAERWLRRGTPAPSGAGSPDAPGPP